MKKEEKMAHEFSVKVQQFISEQMDITRDKLALAESAQDDCEIHFQKGRLMEWQEFRQHLNQKIDLNTQTYF
ncbi:hypothetical protein QUF70_10340 [Desulfobacterales bacterium HSG17]|nr:hypothetical protein [Desulfobacterales bacterium HSG17]